MLLQKWLYNYDCVYYIHQFILHQWFSELDGLPLLDEEPENEEQDTTEEEESIEDMLAGNDSEEKHVVSTTWKTLGA